MTPASILRRQLIPERQRLIIALDHLEPLHAVDLVGDLRHLGVNIFKVSVENLMWEDADELFQYLQLAECRLMFDLKIWDTPDTVARLVDRVVRRYNPMFITVHPNYYVVTAALAAANNASGPIPTLVAPVAYLSSDPDPDTVIPGYEAVGRCTVGVVPAYGVEEYSTYFPTAFLICPGVRLGDQQDNHRKTVSPRQAIALGASYVVVGRPIVAATNPLAAAERYLQDISS